MLDTHTYANPEYDGDPHRDSRTRNRRITLLLRSTRLEVSHRRALDTIRHVCLFVGYPRSGHSLVGSLIDGHRHASIAHEFNVVGLLAKGGFSGRQLEALMLDQSLRTRAGRVWTHGYDYTLEGSHQGVFETPLVVVGDKKGGRTARLLSQDPDLLEKARTKFDERLKLVVHLRNPFDVVSTMSRRRSRADVVSSHVVQDFASVTDGVGVALSALPDSDVFIGHHRDLQEDPGRYVQTLLEFLDLDAPSEFLRACRGLVDSRPKTPRFEVTWSTGTREAVDAIVDRYQFLRGYRFSDTGPHQ